MGLKQSYNRTITKTKIIKKKTKIIKMNKNFKRGEQPKTDFYRRN